MKKSVKKATHLFLQHDNNKELMKVSFEDNGLTAVEYMYIDYNNKRSVKYEILIAKRHKDGKITPETLIMVTYPYKTADDIRDATNDFFEIAKYFFHNKLEELLEELKDLKISVGESLTVTGQINANPPDWN